MVRNRPTPGRLPSRHRKRLDPSLGRRRATPAPREKILVACDERTTAYLDHFRQQLEFADRVTLHTCTSANPVTMVENTLQRFEKTPSFQRLYTLVSHDGKDTAAWQQAYTMVQDHGIANHTVFRLITSVPSFDLWLLLHLADHAMEYGNGSALATCLRSQLSNHLSLATLHQDPKLFEKLQPLLPDAVRRSHLLSRLSLSSFTATPMTEMHELISYLLKWQRRLHYLNSASANTAN